MKFDLLPIFLNLTAAYLILYAIYLIIKFFKKSQRLSASSIWPKVEALVLNKKVICRFTGRHIHYFPELEYKYSVLGNDFNHRSRIDRMISRKSAQKLLDTIGNTLEVRYNPEKPIEHKHEYEKMALSDYSSIVLCLGLGIWFLIMQWL
jgi:hypothetical protein